MNKQPWKMTREEFVGNTHYIETAKNEHAKAVYQAYREGKTIPLEVLKDYPDLLAKDLENFRLTMCQHCGDLSCSRDDERVVDCMRDGGEDFPGCLEECYD